MPTQAEHTEQAKHNKAVLALLPEDAYDWRITLMMYTALHGVHSFFCLRDPSYVHGSYHYGQYSTDLQKKFKQPDMATDFLVLVNHAQTARYKCKSVAGLQSRHRVCERAFDNIMTKLYAIGIHI